MSVCSIRFAFVSLVGAALVACFPLAGVLGHGGGVVGVVAAVAVDMAAVVAVIWAAAWAVAV